MTALRAAFCLAILIGGHRAYANATSSARFLSLAVSPRAAAMGDAHVGVADDVYAAYWNPAGLAQLKVPEAGFMQHQYVADISEQFLAFADPRSKLGVFGGSATYLATGDSPGYDAAGLPTASVSASDLSLALSYAARLATDRRQGSMISVGTTTKYIRERLASVEAHSVAADVGVMAVPGRRWGDALDRWRAGIVLRNLGSTLRFDDESFQLPQSLDGGVSYTGSWRGESFVLALDGKQPRRGRRSFGAGLELQTLRVLLLRAGYTNASRLGDGLRFGAGIRLKLLQIDYAFTDAGAFGSTHRIGLTVRLAKEPPNPQDLAQRSYERGMRLYRTRRYTEALLDFNKALETDPTHPDAFKMMQQTYDQIKISVPE